MVDTERPGSGRGLGSSYFHAYISHCFGNMGANLSDVSNGGGSRGGGLNNPDCTQDDCFINAAR